MGADTTKIVHWKVDATMDINDVKASALQMQKYLNSLALPKDFAASAKIAIDNLNKQIDAFVKQKEAGFSTARDVTNFKNLGKAIEGSFKDVENVFNQLKDIDLSKNFSVDTEEMKKLVTQANLLREQIKQIANSSNISGGYDKVLAKTSKPTPVMQNMSTALKSGDIDQITKAYEQLQQVVASINTRYVGNTEVLTRWNNVMGAAKTAVDNFKTSTGGLSNDLTRVEGEMDNLRNNGLQQIEKGAEDAASSTAEMGAVLKTTILAEEDMAKESYSLQSQVQSLADRFLQFTSITGMITLLSRAVRDAYQNVKELDAVMNSIAVVTQYTTSDLWNQVDSYNALASSMGATISGTYEVAKLYYQQGKSTADMNVLLTETLKLARIGELNYADATDYMTVALNGFKMEAKDASKIVDVYSNLAAKAAADQNEIAIAMSKTASLADSVGMSFENTSAFLTKIIETTREAPETAGTALKTIIARFAEMKTLISSGQLTGIDTEGEEININKIDVALKKVGISMLDTSGQMRNLDEVFLELSSKWDTLDSNTQHYLATTAAGARQQSRFIAMMDNYKRTLELTNYATNAAGAGQKQFEKTQDSLTSKLNALNDAWVAFTTSIADSKVIKNAVDLLTKLLEIINGITDLFGPLSGGLKAVIGVGLLSYLGSVVSSLLTAGAAAKKAGTSFLSFKVAQEGIINGTKEWVGSIGGSIGKVSSAFQTIKSQFTAISDLKKIGGLGDKLLNLDAAEEDVTDLVSYGEELSRQYNLQDIAQQIGNVLGKEDLGVEEAIDVVKTSQIAKEELLNSLKMAGIALGVAAVAGVIALAVHMGKVNSYEYKSKKLAEERGKTESKISDIEEEIANFKDKYDGKAINADEQARLQILNEQLKVQQEQLKNQKQQQFELDQSKENKISYAGATPEAQVDGYGVVIGDKTTATGDVDTVNETTRVITEQIRKQAELNKLMDDEKDPEKWEQYNQQYKDVQAAKEANYELLVSSTNNLTTAQETGLTLTEEETEAIGTATQYITDHKDQIYEYAGAVDKAKVSISAIAKGLSGFQEGVSSIGEALTAFQEDGQVSIDVLSKIGENEAFKDISEQVNDFINVLGDSNSTQEQAQESANNLVSAYLDSSAVLKNLTDDNKNLYITQLKAMGITNADAIVTQKLNDIKAQAAVNSIDFQNATGADIIQLYNEANAAGYTTLALTNALLAKVSMQNSGLDLNGQEAALLGLASSADISAEALTIVNNMLLAIGKIKQATATGDLRMGQGYTAYLEGQKRQLDDLLKDGKGTKGNVTPTFSGVAKSSSEEEEAKAKLSIFYNYEQAAKSLETELKNLDSVIKQSDTVAGKVSGMQKKVNMYKKLTSQTNEYLSALRQEISSQQQQGLNKYSGYIGFANDGSLRLLSSYYSLTGDTVTELEDWVSSYEELLSKQDELNESLNEYYNSLSDMFKEWRDDYISLVDDLADILKEKDEEELKRKEEYYDKLKQQDKDYLDALKKNIDARRKARDRETAKEDLVSQQKRLSLLQRDTSGAYTSEIASLQKEIQTAKQSMEDTLIDDQLSLMQDQFDKTAQFYDDTLNKMQDNIDVNKETNQYIKQAEITISTGNDAIKNLVQSSKDYQQTSQADQNKKLEDLSTQIANAQSYQNAGGNSVKTGNQYATNTASAPSSSTSSASSSTSVAPSYGLLYGLSGSPILSQGSSGSAVKTLQEGINNMISAGLLKNGNTPIAKLAVDGGFGSKTAYAVKAVQRLLTTSYGANLAIDGGFGPMTAAAMHKHLPAYLNGGLVDFTGPAWVDGSISSPEAFLNAQDTKNFEQLKLMLSNIFKNKIPNFNNNFNSDASNMGMTIYVNVDSVANDQEIQKAINKVKKEILDNSNYRNINVVSRVK